MRLSFLPFAILFCVLVFLPACSDDSGPTNPNDTTKTIDTTDTTKGAIDTLDPCKGSQNPQIQRDGFVLDGGGFSNAVFNFDPDSTLYNYTTIFDPVITALYSRVGPVRLTTNQLANVRMSIQYPDTLRTFELSSLEIPGAPYVRIEIEQNGVTKVLKPYVGALKVLQTKQATLYGFGTFCGYLKDSVSGTVVSVKSGKYHIE